MRWREAGDVRWLQAELPGARAAFTTRLGGVSEGPFATLDIGLASGDEHEPVLENRRRLAAALELDPARIGIARQVHGSALTDPRSRPARSPYAAPAPDGREADGHVLERLGEAALVLVADCLPVAVVGPGGAAILHCGWRGLAAGIVARGAAAVRATHAAIGPGIGPCCYEVGGEVLAAFAHLGEGVADGRMLDLPEAARRLLAEAGVEEVHSAGLCTSCDPDLFFSYRRDGTTGRQAGVCWLPSE
jgi:YfiH family protein